jgi:RNA polymerase sigma-70 factor (ECF subfamily)
MCFDPFIPLAELALHIRQPSAAYLGPNSLCRNPWLSRFEIQATRSDIVMNLALKQVNSNLTLNERTVSELVLMAQSGDRQAFGELFERYRAGIVALALRRVRNVDEAEELTQDVFIQAMQKIDQLRVPDAFGGWLRRIVHRMAINRATRTRVAIACDPDTLEVTCFSLEAPGASVEDREQAAAVREGIERLGKMDRQTLKAFYLRGRSLLEMSDEFSAPVGTIKRRLHVARKRLAKELDLAEAV